MRLFYKLTFCIFTWLATFAVHGQTNGPASTAESEQLAIAALEGLIAAPPGRALPRVKKVLESEHSDKVKSRALFVLSQVNHPEAHSLLLEMAGEGTGQLRNDAIRMIGIGGDTETLAGLASIYKEGDKNIKSSVLQAYLIAGDTKAVYELASNADNEEEFDSAVQTLGAMGAHEELRKLRTRGGDSESLIHAYAIAGDLQSLLELANDTENPKRQAQAIRGLGIVGGAQAKETLVELYRDALTESVRGAALQGMLVANHDQGVLQLYQGSQSAKEKSELLRMLVIMDSDIVMEVIDNALESNR